MILARYLLAQFIPPFLFGLTLFSGVLLLDKIFDLLDLLINKGVSLVLSVKIFLLFLPTILSLSVPMSILLACLLTFGRLSEDNEILALRSSGLSFRQILWPPFLLAGIMALVLIPFNAQLTPRAMNSFRSIYHKIATTDPLIQIEPRRFVAVRNIRLYATEVEKETKRLRGVWLYRLFPALTERVYAPEGTWEVNSSQLSLNLSDGQIERFQHLEAGNFLHVDFKGYTVNVPFMGALNARDRSWREFPADELRREMARRRIRKLPLSEIESEYHLRFALAFAPIALALVGIPLGMTLERGGRGVGFGAAVGVLFLYYLLLVMGMNIADRGTWPALPALWIANGTASLVGLILFRRRLAA